jgi:glucose-6-phosphatase
MHGERPYWWVHEMEEAHKLDAHPHKIAEIHQYSSTCETGPGMPSGHSMAMSAAWYVIIHAIVEHVVDPSNMRYFSIITVNGMN